MSQNRFVYAGARRNTISFPLGGIGTGCIGLDGTGHLIDWEIYNKPNKGSRNGFTHFALKASDKGKTVDARVLHADVPGPYMGGSGGGSFGGFGFGVDRYTMTGVPHFPDCVFTGKFPFAGIEFLDDSFPGRVALTAFNPFIPTNEDDSSIPAAFLAYTVTNTTERPLDYTLAGSLNNPYAAKAGENRYTVRNGAHCLTAFDRAHGAADFAYGDLTLATDAEDVCAQEYWFRGAWFDNINVFWQNFTADGRLQNRRYPYNPYDKTPHEDVGTLAAHFRLAPGEVRTVRFVISWNVPNNQNYWNPPDPSDEPAADGCCGDGCCCGGGAAKAGSWKNYYATLFRDSPASAGYALRNWERLERDTQLFTDALFSSTLPEAALEAVSATMSVLKSPTVLRLEDGSLYGWEGCHCDCGCCEGSCSHVWAYTYALPFLFPRLERSMRDLEYAYTQGEDGGLSFRLQLPLGRGRWAFRPCADGQFATVFKTYRDYKICGDRQWLADKWPQVQKAIAYAWSEQNADRWDPDRSGVLTGRQRARPLRRTQRQTRRRPAARPDCPPGPPRTGTSGRDMPGAADRARPAAASRRRTETGRRYRRGRACDISSHAPAHRRGP